MNETLKTKLKAFGTDFLEGAAAGAITAFLAAGNLNDAKALAYIVILGAFDGAISAARRAVVAAAPAK